MRRVNVLRISLLWLLILCLAGCMSSARQVPANWKLTFNRTSATNNGAPLKIRVFLLRSDANFTSADFYSLQNNAENVTGGDVLESQQFFLTQQAGDKILQGNSPPEARFIGIIAEYQSINGKSWRLSLPLPAPLTTNFYKFWQFSPDEMKGVVDATAGGLQYKPTDD